MVETNGFYISCFLLLAASLTGYNHYRTLAFRRQKYKLEKMVEERTVQYKIQKERAEKSEQFHRQFLANMSHEIQKGNYESGILNGLRILLADDNEYNRFVVTESLHFKFDLQIDMAITGKEAVEKMKQQDYDVILMDLQMPVMDGL